jgi:kynurenine formamidase
MKAAIQSGNESFTIDLLKPLDISIPLQSGSDNLTAWYQPPPEIRAVEMEGFVGNVRKGGSVNFNNVFFNPHAHGTHTECVGHISAGQESVNQALQHYFYKAELVSIAPEEQANGDKLITLAQLKEALGNSKTAALVVRTLPNPPSKKSTQYSHSNPPYVEADAMTFLIERGINHFLIDQPSVDREEDGGRLAAHKAFWEFETNKNISRTITELIYVPEEIEDGSYLLEMQMASFENDASPSRPVLYKIEK